MPYSIDNIWPNSMASVTDGTSNTVVVGEAAANRLSTNFGPGATNTFPVWAGGNPAIAGQGHQYNYFRLMDANYPLNSTNNSGESSGALYLDRAFNSQNGAPYAVGEGEGVTITLTCTDGKTTCTAQSQPDGTFSIQKPGGGPIPAGKYKASYVYQLAADPYTKKKGLKYGKELPEEWDVSPANSSFAIDIRQK